jgi:hypothetical protein
MPYWYRVFRLCHSYWAVNHAVYNVEFLWYISFCLPIIISPMSHIGVQYITNLAVCHRPDQAEDYSFNPQFGLKVLQWLDCIQQRWISCLVCILKEGTPIESDRNLTAPVRACSLLTAWITRRMGFIARADGGRNCICGTVVSLSKTWVCVHIPVRYFHPL